MEPVDPLRPASAPHQIPVAEAALFLDLDGAIVPIVSEPDAAKASLPCRIVLRRSVEELAGRVAIVSGRTIASVDLVLNGAIPCVAGVHGLQRRSVVTGFMSVEPHERIKDAVSVFEALASARPGLFVEPKGQSVAIHYRGAPGAEEAVLEVADRVSVASGLTVQRGKMVVELRTPGPDKGEAVAQFMSEAPFTGARAIFIGDDLTDEAGFMAARAQRGFGILVGDRTQTAATARLADPVATLSWILRSLETGFFDASQCE